jgi:hypothetical protein
VGVSLTVLWWWSSWGQMSKKGPLFREEKVSFHQQFTTATKALDDKRLMLTQLLDDLGA